MDAKQNISSMSDMGAFFEKTSLGQRRFCRNVPCWLEAWITFVLVNILEFLSP